MQIRWKEHQRLEVYCKSVCTGKLGWNRDKRTYCREHTMCQRVYRMHHRKNICPKCGHDLTLKVSTQ